MHSKIGKVSFGTDKLLENFYVFMDAILRARPPAAKRSICKKRDCESIDGARSSNKSF